MSRDGSHLAAEAAREWESTSTRKRGSPGKSASGSPRRSTDAEFAPHRHTNGDAPKRSLPTRGNHTSPFSDASSPRNAHEAAPIVLSARRGHNHDAWATQAAEPATPESPWPHDVAGGFFPYTPKLDLGSGSPPSTVRPASAVPHRWANGSAQRSPRWPGPGAPGEHGPRVRRGGRDAGAAPAARDEPAAGGDCLDGGGGGGGGGGDGGDGGDGADGSC